MVYNMMQNKRKTLDKGNMSDKWGGICEYTSASHNTPYPCKR